MNFSERDQRVIWHPYTPAKGTVKPCPIKSARGSYLYDYNGQRIIDAISSWWVNTHGHGHPHIAEKVSEQIKQLDHVIFAGFTHEPAIALAERLLERLPDNQARIFYSDNGSTAVEVALKTAIQYYLNKGQKRSRIVAFEEAYHGDTFGAMSVSAHSIFTAAFTELTFEIHRIKLPANGNEQLSLDMLESFLKSGEVAAFIFEPLVLGAGGMLMYEPKALNRLIQLCKKYDTLTIADEVMTGFYRTGRFFASDYLTVKPDIFCLSKGITGGVLPLGVTSCSKDVFSAFDSDDIQKTLFHGHSYTGNPVACAAALAAMDLYDMQACAENVDRINKAHLFFKKRIEKHPLVVDARVTGTIIAIEIKTAAQTSYTNTIRETIVAFFMEKRILIRPLGNVIYVLPPYCISAADLHYIYDSIEAFCEKLLRQKDL